MEFVTVSKTSKISSLDRKRSKYDKLLDALETMPSEMSIMLKRSAIDLEFSSFKASIRQAARRRGMNLAIVEEGSNIYIWSRSS